MPSSEEEQRRKIWVGSLLPEVTTHTLTRYFESYGSVVDTFIAKDRNTGVSRGFGFVTFQTVESVQAALMDRHVIDGKQALVKSAVKERPGGRDAAPSAPQPDTCVVIPGQHRVTFGGLGSPGAVQQQRAPQVTENLKVYVGDLDPAVTSDYLKAYFAARLEVGGTGNELLEADVKWDTIKNESRCFGYVKFADPNDMQRVLKMGEHIIMEKKADVRNAAPMQVKKGVARGNARGSFYTPIQTKRSVEICPPGENARWFAMGRSFGRRGWKAGYGSFSFGPHGWAVDGWEGGEQVEGLDEIKDSKGADWLGFSFGDRFEEDKEKEKIEKIEKEAKEARERDAKRARIMAL